MTDLVLLFLVRHISPKASRRMQSVRARMGVGVPGMGLERQFEGARVPRTWRGLRDTGKLCMHKHLLHTAFMHQWKLPRATVHQPAQRHKPWGQYAHQFGEPHLDVYMHKRTVDLSLRMQGSRTCQTSRRPPWPCCVLHWRGGRASARCFDPKSIRSSNLQSSLIGLQHASAHFAK